MRFERPFCPECGAPAASAWEAVPRLISLRPERAADYAGEWEHDPGQDDVVFSDGGWWIDAQDLRIARDEGDERIQLHCGEHSWMTHTIDGGARPPAGK